MKSVDIKKMEEIETNAESEEKQTNWEMKDTQFLRKEKKNVKLLLKLNQLKK